MTNRVRVYLLALIMTTVSLSVCGIVLVALYRTAFEEQRARLVETAQSQARLIESVARFAAQSSAGDVPGGPFAATLSQVRDAHERLEGFARTGEFTLARREGDLIVFLLRHRHLDFTSPEPVLFNSENAEPMRRALLGESGTVVGLDYRGEIVLAAHEPVAELELGIVLRRWVCSATTLPVSSSSRRIASFLVAS